MGPPRHPNFLLQVWLNTHSAAKLPITNQEDSAEHPQTPPQALRHLFPHCCKAKTNTVVKTRVCMGEGVRASAGCGVKQEHEGKIHREIVRADTLLVHIKVASLTLPCPGWVTPPVPCFLK